MDITTDQGGTSERRLRKKMADIVMDQVMVQAGKVWSTLNWNGPSEEPANQGQGEGRRREYGPGVFSMDQAKVRGSM